MPAVLNAANETAVAAFLEGKLTFPGIARVIRQTMESHKPMAASRLDDIMEVDRWARRRAVQIVQDGTG